jgi:hypothetical protein
VGDCLGRTANCLLGRTWNWIRQLANSAFEHLTLCTDVVTWVSTSFYLYRAVACAKQ